MSVSRPVPAEATGTIDLGGDLMVNRLGFGSMRITGAGICGPPPDREAKAVLRRADEENVAAAAINRTTGAAVSLTGSAG